jgi:hypothetical protein
MYYILCPLIDVNDTHLKQSLNRPRKFKFDFSVQI